MLAKMVGGVDSNNLVFCFDEPNVSIFIAPIKMKPLKMEATRLIMKANENDRENDNGDDDRGDNKEDYDKKH